MSDREELAGIIWETSRGDESTISAIGANHVADAILASDWLARHDAAIGERIALAIEAEMHDPDSYSTANHAYADAARIARTTETVSYDGLGAPIVGEGL